jgi:cytidylate kinase
MEFKDLINLKEAGTEHPYAYKAVFMAGGPGSGKTYWSKNLFTSLGFSFSNSDNILELLARTRNAPLDPSHPDFEPTVSIAQKVTQRRTESWIENGIPLVIDITGRNRDLVLNLNNQLIKKGYDTGMIFVNSSLNSAIEKNSLRDRQVDRDFLIQAWNDAQRNRYYYNELFGEKYIEINTEANTYTPKQILNRVIGNPHQINNPIGKEKIINIIKKTNRLTRQDVKWTRNLTSTTNV